jgi:hypothetical protein
MVMYQCVLFTIFVAIYSSMNFRAHFEAPNPNAPITPITITYFTLASQTTTGFGDIHPKTDPARILVSIHILLAWIPMIMIFS